MTVKGGWAEIFSQIKSKEWNISKMFTVWYIVREMGNIGGIGKNPNHVFSVFHRESYSEIGFARNQEDAIKKCTSSFFSQKMLLSMYLLPPTSRATWLGGQRKHWAGKGSVIFIYRGENGWVNSYIRRLLETRQWIFDLFSLGLIDWQRWTGMECFIQI